MGGEKGKTEEDGRGEMRDKRKEGGRGGRKMKDGGRMIIN